MTRGKASRSSKQQSSSATAPPAGPRVAYANLGAEEPDGATAGVDAVARLAAHFRNVVESPPASWTFLAEARGLVPWLATPAAAQEAKRAGLPLWGASPEVVAQVHDKAFAARFVDDELQGLVTVLGADAGADAVERAVASWPAWARQSFTLKPRWGTSGRGRVAGKDGTLPAAARKALPRVLARGGAVLEPWLERTLDLSTQWHVAGPGAVALLGVTKQIVRGAGVWLGCQLNPGTPWDEQAIAGGRKVVEAAAAAGFVGVCGVDSFVWKRDGKERLRAVVELNARFTGGAVAVALEGKTFRLDR